MKEIIENLRNVYNSMMAKDKDLANQIEKAKVQQSELSKQKQDLVNKKIELDLREKEIKRIEDLVAYSKDIDERAKKVSDAEHQLRIERNAFSSYSGQMEKEFASKTNNLNERQRVINEKEAKLTEDRAMLEVEKEGYKKEIRDKIADSILK